LRDSGAMSKFGAGFGKDAHLLVARPCRTTQSVQNQKHFSRRLETDIFSGSSFQDPRPTWWRNEANETFRVPSPSRLGEWKLVWRPKDGAAPPEAEKPWGRETRFDVVGSGPLLHSYRDHFDRVGSRRSSRVASRRGETAAGSQRSQSALECRDDLEAFSSQVLGTGRVNVDSLHEQVGAATSHRSLGSRASRRSRASTVLSEHPSTASTGISGSAILSRSVGESPIHRIVKQTWGVASCRKGRTARRGCLSLILPCPCCCLIRALVTGYET
jgi:hypothetical protein